MVKVSGYCPSVVIASLSLLVFFHPSSQDQSCTKWEVLLPLRDTTRFGQSNAINVNEEVHMSHLWLKGPPSRSSASWCLGLNPNHPLVGIKTYEFLGIGIVGMSLGPVFLIGHCL